MIVTDLQGLATPIDELHEMPGNPRRGNVDAVAISLDTFGQRKPIVALPDGTVIAGNHTLAAARQLGWTEIAVVRVADTDEAAKAYSLADNRTAELGGYDEDALAAMLAEIAGVDSELFAATGWKDTDLAKLLGNEQSKPVDTTAMLDAQSYAVIVTCTDEMHQADLLDQFQREGLSARPLMM